MIRVEYVGVRSGCPFCGREIAESGKCKCGAEIEIRNLTQAAAADGEELTREEAKKTIQTMAKFLAKMAKLAPFRVGTAMLAFHEEDGRFFSVIAKK